MTLSTFDSILLRHLRFAPEGQPLDPDASLRELGLDSMQSVELLFDLEDRYRVSLDDEALTADTFATARSLREAVMRAGGTEELAS
jgi:acyl carrier protein